MRNFAGFCDNSSFIIHNNMSILKNFLFVLKRYKTTSVLNFLGLSAAFVAFIIIITQVDSEFSFDKFHKNANRIYRVDNVTQGLFGIIQPRPLVESFFDSSPEIEAGTVLMPYLGEQYFTTENNGVKAGHKYNIVTCSPAITRIFSFKMVEGSPDCLQEPQNILIPQSIARQLFGNTTALGQLLSFKSTIWTKESQKELIVGGVYKDFPENTQLNNHLYTAIDKDAQMKNWGSNNFIAYVLLKENSDPGKLADHFNKHFDFNHFGYDSNMSVKLTPLTSIYLKNESTDGLTIKSGNPATINVLLTITILTITIAIINYMNFNMALAPRRIKSINTRKVFGETDLSLRTKIIIEGILMSLIAYLVAIVLVFLIHINHILPFIDININPLRNTRPIIIAGVIAIITGFVCAIRPAYFLTSGSPAIVLTGSFGLSQKGKVMRDILIGFQFAISIILIIVSIFIYKQNHFMQTYDLGFDKDQIAIVELDADFMNQHKREYENALKDNPAIIDVAYSQQKFGASDEYRQESLKVGEQKYSLFYINVSWNFLDVMGIHLQEGNMPVESDETDWTSLKKNKNEFMGQAYGNSTPKLIINKKLSEESGLKPDLFADHFGNNVQITGVTDNIQFTSLRRAPHNAALVINDPTQMNCSYIKIKAGQNIPAVVKHIEKTIANIDPSYPINIEFYDKVFENLYKKELDSEKIITSFSLLAIIISIMGVFGLVRFECEYRKKEIGIRKVLGSYNREILLLFNSQYLKIFAVCFVFAIPVAAYITNRWLDNFAYKTGTSWWVFLLSGSVILLIISFTVTWQSWLAATANPVESLKTE